MSFLRFRPEIWSARLLVALEKVLIFGSPTITNRDYEGEIAQAGDTVRITSISDPTIDDYVAGVTTITPEQLTDAQRTLVVDQCKYFAFEVDDVDARQIAGNVMPTAMERAAYKLKDTIDQFLAAFYTGAQSANVVDEVTVDLSPTDWDTEAAKAYNEILVPLKVVLDEANVQSDGRYCTMPPWLHGVLLRDPRFVEANKAGTTTGLRQGVVGQAAGFDILISNNCPNPSGSSHIVQAGVNSALTFAQQINKTEAYRPQDSFSDAVKGLTLYGGKLIRPESIAYATATSS